jgi:hypothetical protein
MQSLYGYQAAPARLVALLIYFFDKKYGRSSGFPFPKIEANVWPCGQW